MAFKSAETKKLSTKLTIIRIIDAIIVLAPVILCLCVALFSDAATVAGKVTVIGLLTVATIIEAIGFFIGKYSKRPVKLRSPIWIILIGLHFAIDKCLLPFIILMAISRFLHDILEASTPGIEEKLTRSKDADKVKERLTDC